MGYVRFFNLISSDHAFMSTIFQADFNKNKTLLVEVLLVQSVLWLFILLACLRVCTLLQYTLQVELSPFFQLHSYFCHFIQTQKMFSTC